MSLHSELVLLRADFAGALLMSAAYGAYVVVVVLTCYLLFKRGRAYRGRKAMLAYTALMWVLTSVWFFAVAREQAFIFVDTRLSPHLRLSGCSPGQLTPKVAAMLQILASDGALLYRAYILWEGNLRVMGPLFLIYLVQIGSGVLADLHCFYEAPVVLRVLNDLMFSTTLVLNLLATVVIVCRILILRRRMKIARAMPTGIERRVLSTAALLAGSAALYALSIAVDQALFFLGLSIFESIGALWQILAFISPALIILHVAMGVALDSGDEAPERDPPQNLLSDPSAPTQGSKWVPDTYDEKAACVDQPEQFTGPSAV